MSLSSSNEQTAKFKERARKRGQILFVIGWLFTLLNIAGIVWAIYLPMTLKAMPEGVFFMLDDGTHFALVGILILIGFLLLGVLQIAFLDRIGARMVEDVEENVAAEASLRLAKFVSYFTILACIGSLLYDVKTYRTWADQLRVLDIKG